MPTYPEIIKADGSREAFDPARLIASLERAGAGKHAAERIAENVIATLVPGATSREVYAHAFALLRKEARPVAARYALRRALLELGPTGHPFEDFVMRLFQAEGWQLETRRMIQGKCVAHETDLYGKHEKKGCLAAELKFHNDPAYKTDLKVALYAKARFDDIFGAQPSVRSTCPVDHGLLVTNTKFTSEAIAYAACAGLELLGWGYPERRSLRERMMRARIYPVTTLTSLTKSEKRMLSDARIVTVDEILADRTALDFLHLPPERSGALRAEAEGLLALPHPFRDTP